MNKRGFLLSELLSIIVVISVIFVITVTTFFSVIDDSKSNLSNSQYDLFINAAKLYMMSLLDNNNINEISLNDLIAANFLKNEIFIDPHTNRIIDNNSTIIIDQENNEYKFVNYYSTDNLILNIDSYNPITNFCNNLICNNGYFDQDNNHYFLNEIFVNLNRYENYTISFYMNVNNEYETNNFSHSNDLISLNDVNIYLNTINEYAAYDIIKNGNYLIIYINGNQVYNNYIDNYISSIDLKNNFLVKNIRFYTTNLDREDILFNYNISIERFD